MNVEPQLLEELAADSGFRPEMLERVLRFGDLGADIARHPFLGEVLALKGGTALNLFFGAPRRLSVDLDFNYVGALDRDEMVKDREEIEVALEGLAQRKGYRVQRSPDKHAGRKLFLAYTSARGAPDRLEVDINYLFREPVTEVATGMMWQPGDAPRPAMKVVGLSELCAGKVCALLSRVVPRDLFDVGFLPEIVGTQWGELRLRRIIIAFSAILEHPLDRYGRDRLERVTDRVVTKQLAPMLSHGRAVTASELKAKAWKAIAPILDLTPEEREYVHRIQQGELHPELLFADDEVLRERFARHPALRWKADNARRFRASQRPQRP